jgi:hypothetical protein
VRFRNIACAPSFINDENERISFQRRNIPLLSGKERTQYNKQWNPNPMCRVEQDALSYYDEKLLERTLVVLGQILGRPHIVATLFTPTRGFEYIYHLPRSMVTRILEQVFQKSFPLRG